MVPSLSEIEIRVLGSLIEKEMATPEYYPLSLNALITACNQRTNRDPVLALDEEEVEAALGTLKAKHLIFENDGGRVAKFWQDFTKQNGLRPREAAVLCMLLLRGPQTPGELRSRCESLCPAGGMDDLHRALDALVTAGLAIRLPLRPGRKEQRYTHLLSGAPGDIDLQPARPEPVKTTTGDRVAELERTVAELRLELAELKAEVAVLGNRIKVPGPAGREVR